MSVVSNGGRRIPRGRIRLEEFHELAADLLCVQTFEGDLLWWNPAFERTLGFGPAELAGMSAGDLIHPDDLDSTVDLLPGLARGDQLVGFVNRYRTRSGDWRYIEWTARAVAGERLAYAAGRDVTERYETEVVLERRERALEAILRASPDIVSVLDSAGVVSEVSDVSMEILGYRLSGESPDEASTVVHPDDLALVTERYRALFSGKATYASLRCRVRHARGHYVHLDSRARSIRDEEGKVVGVVVVARDATADLAAEEQLRSACEAAEKALREKADFMSMMSHELRNPLNAILGFGQLLQMDELAPDQAQAVEHIMMAGHHVLGMAEELLDLARLDSGRLAMDIAPVEVLGVAEEALALNAPSAASRRVSISLSGPRRLLAAADRQHLLQILVNLVSNAVKYNHPGGSVVVSWAPASDGQVRIDVADSGPGIAPGTEDRLFKLFDRLGAETTGVDGAGVGLALSRRLAAAMGGTLELSSSSGAGSVFSILLPPPPPQGAYPKGERVESGGTECSGEGREASSDDPLASFPVGVP